MTTTPERPSWFSRLDTSRCQEHFDKVEAFALEQGRHEQFMDRLERLCMGDRADDEMTWWGEPVDALRVRLFYDFAPESFEFFREVKKTAGDDWATCTHGGLIFHGSHDNGGDGGAPSFSVNITPQDGWSIHT